jgi:predicted RNase H-like nuclease
VRATLAYNTYVEASDASLSASGKRISRQTFGILPHIREVDAAMTPALQWRVFEVHPEVAFRALNDDARLIRKRDIAGSEARAALLSGVYGFDVAALHVPRGAARDDLYDAAVCAWTAERIANGTARRLPEVPAIDSHGLRMEIWY